MAFWRGHTIISIAGPMCAPNITLFIKNFIRRRLTYADDDQWTTDQETHDRWSHDRWSHDRRTHDRRTHDRRTHETHKSYLASFNDLVVKKIVFHPTHVVRTLITYDLVNGNRKFNGALDCAMRIAKRDGIELCWQKPLLATGELPLL